MNLIHVLKMKVHKWNKLEMLCYDILNYNIQ